MFAFRYRSQTTSLAGLEFAGAINEFSHGASSCMSLNLSVELTRTISSEPERPHFKLDNASRAAFCCASLLLRPLPTPTT
jgi:hypothetical protein